MKLPLKLAGTWGTGVFLLVSLTTYFGNLDWLSLLMGKAQEVAMVTDVSLAKPLKVFTLALPSAIAAGFLGYFFGKILSQPKGKIKPITKPQKKSPLEEMLEKEGLTGDETFLNELEQPKADGSQASAAPASPVGDTL